MKEINLLPSGLTARSSINKFLKIVSTLNIIGSIVFGICLLLFASIILINTQRLNSSREKVETLKLKVKSLQSLEQQYYLLKGRLESLDKIYADNKVFQDINDFKSLYSAILGNGNMTTADVQPLKTEVSLSFDSSLKMKELFSRLNSVNYSDILMDSLSFNPTGGYQTVLKLTK